MPRVLSKADISDFRDRLCDAAEKLFADHGLEAVTMRQLANALGVSPMTPYRYFADKDAILAAVRARAFDRHAEALETAHAATGSEDARADRVARAYVRFALDHPEAYKLMFDIALRPTDKDFPDLVRAATRSRQTMTHYLRALQAAGKFDGDIELVGHMYWAALHGPIMLQLSGMLPSHLGAETLADAIVAAMDRSLFKVAG